MRVRREQPGPRRRRRGTAASVVTLQLGQPPLGALQLRFPPGRRPGRAGRRRSSRASPSAPRTRSARPSAPATPALELERSRALLSVVGEAIARLSLSHTLETAIERVAELLGSDRVAVYLREDGDEIVVAASRGIEGPHEAIADALLAVALRSRQAAAIVEVDDAPMSGSSTARAQVERVGNRLRARARRSSSATSRSASSPSTRAGPAAERRTRARCSTALAGQLAVVVQNARLHEDVTS